MVRGFSVGRLAPGHLQDAVSSSFGRRHSRACWGNRRFGPAKVRLGPWPVPLIQQLLPVWRLCRLSLVAMGVFRAFAHPRPWTFDLRDHPGQNCLPLQSTLTLSRRLFEHVRRRMGFVSTRWHFGHFIRHAWTPRLSWKTSDIARSKKMEVFLICMEYIENACKGI